MWGIKKLYWFSIVRNKKVNVVSIFEVKYKRDLIYLKFIFNYEYDEDWLYEEENKKRKYEYKKQKILMK